MSAHWRDMCKHLGNHAAVAFGLRLGVLFCADVLLADSKGWTPLHLAARSGTADKVQCLLEAGAKTDAVNNQGNTPLHLVGLL